MLCCCYSTLSMIMSCRSSGTFREFSRWSSWIQPINQPNHFTHRSIRARWAKPVVITYIWTHPPPRYRQHNHIRTCCLYCGLATPAGGLGPKVAKYNAESPKKGSQRFECMVSSDDRLCPYTRIWLEPEPSLWPGSGFNLNISLTIEANYMELDLIWCLFYSKHKLWPICTGTCIRTYFRQFAVSLKKFQHYVLFYQEPEPEPAPDRKFPEPEPPQNRPAPKTWYKAIE